MEQNTNTLSLYGRGKNHQKENWGDQLENKKFISDQRYGEIYKKEEKIITSIAMIFKNAYLVTEEAASWKQVWYSL